MACSNIKQRKKENGMSIMANGEIILA